MFRDLTTTDFSRRKFLRGMGGCALGAAAASCLGGMGSAAFGAETLASDPKSPPPDPKTMQEADPRYWKAMENNKVECSICDNKCVIENNANSFCRTRNNVGGKLYTAGYNNPCILRLDEIEKIPFYHFAPGQKVLTVATGGCNLRCLYCQNWEMSQGRPETQKTKFKVPKEDAVRGAIDKKVAAIAYTYTDPVAFYEYARDIAAAGKEKGVKTVVGTALYIHPDPLKEWCKYVDGFAVTLKGFSEKYYEKVLGVKLKPVLDALQVVKSEGKWLEVVTLLVPTYNDDPKVIREMAKWIRTNLGEDTPWHFERFYPQYKLRDLQQTPIQTLEQARQIGLDEGLKHVYLCNVSPHEANNTYCPKCKEALIKRLGFTVLPGSVTSGVCPKCQTKLAGVWTSPASQPT